METQYRGRLRIYLLPLIAVIALAGCFDLFISTEERAEQAIESYEDNRGPGGEVSKVAGTINTQSGEVDHEIRFGSNDVTQVTLSDESGQIRIWCLDDRSIEETRYNAISDVEVFETRLSFLCPDAPGEEVESVDLVDATENDDGTISATELTKYEDGTEGINTYLIDQDGRVLEVTYEGDDGESEWTVHYAVRRHISAPDPDYRKPTEVRYETDFDDGLFEMEIKDPRDRAPLSELEVHVLQNRRAEEPIALFDPSGVDDQTEAGFTFRYEAAGNGNLTEGDRLTVSNPEWEREEEYAVRLFDTWAGAYVGGGQGQINAPGEVGVPNVALTIEEVQAVDVDCDEWGEETQCHTVRVRVENDGDREANMWGGNWGGEASDGGMYDWPSKEGPDEVAAGSASTVTLAFDIPPETHLTKLHYQAGSMQNSISAEIPEYEVERWDSRVNMTVLNVDSREEPCQEWGSDDVCYTFEIEVENNHPQEDVKAGNTWNWDAIGSDNGTYDVDGADAPDRIPPGNTASATVEVGLPAGVTVDELLFEDGWMPRKMSVYESG